jgi:hypothetical protein
MKPTTVLLQIILITNMNRIKSFFILTGLLLFLFTTVHSQNKLQNSYNEIPGMCFFDRILGQWHGPVSSNTPAGDFDMWYVDFRPVSIAQVSQFSTLDPYTQNYISFLIVKYKSELKIAMRTEGVFMGEGCVTYEFMDSVNAKAGYYRFSDVIAGEKRAVTEFFFREDKLIMQTFTNVFNQKDELTIHSKWKAKLGCRKEALATKEELKFPKAQMIADFSEVFKGMKESIFFNLDEDPFPVSEQPYVGSLKLDIKLDDSIELSESNEIFIVLTTESLFDGVKYREENQKYISKYVYLLGNSDSYTFLNLHPGKYYIYTFVDKDGDKLYRSGDYMSSDISNIVTIHKEEQSTAKTKIDFIIP